MKLIKRTMSMILAAAMLLSACPVPAAAAETLPQTMEAMQETAAPVETAIVTEAPEETPPPVETVGETVGEETEAPVFSGETPVPLLTEDAFAYKAIDGTTCELTGYTGTETELTVPETLGGYTVKGIGVSAFEGNKNLKKVTLPETLTYISRYAFRNCTGLESIDIPDSVTTLEKNAFVNCTALKEVGFPAGLTTISGYDAATPFGGCSSLTKIEIPEGVTAIPANTFRNLTSLETVILPSTLKSIGSQAFQNCQKLKDIQLPEGLETISSNAFSECYALAEIILPESLTTLSSSAFQNCRALTEITVPEGITTIHNYVFNNCTGLKEVILPETLKSITMYAFQNCTALESIDIPDSVTTLEKNAFANCTALKEVGYPAGLTTISGYDAATPFGGCSNLTKIEIPEGVTAIPANTFRNLTSLETVILPSTLKSIGSQAFQNCQKLKDIQLPEGLETISSNAFSECYALAEIILPESLTTLSSSAFQNCRALTEITVPEGITTIHNYVFNNCTGLKKVILPETLKSITMYAFQNCTALESIDIPDSVTTLEKNAFVNCTALKEVGYPAGLTTISGYDAATPFGGCSSLTKIEIPEGVTAIPANTFRNLTSLETVILPSTLKSIGSQAFQNCQKLKDIQLPEGLETISSNAFSECYALAEIILPESLTTLSSSAFQNCRALTEITVPEGITTIHNYVFNNCTGLKKVILPETLKSITMYAFQNCTALESIDIPDSVTTLEKNAFVNCTALKEVGYPAGLTTISGYDAATPFGGCSSLTKIEIPEGVTAIPANTFRNLTSLETIVLPSTLKSIGSNAFNACSSLKNINLEEGFETLGNGVFNGCKSLETIELPESLITLSENVFFNCTGLKSITIPKSITMINANVFFGCTSLKEVNLPETLTNISRYAFYGCTGLESIHIPDGVTNLGSRAFLNCTALKEVNYPKSLQKIDTTANYRDTPFYGCSSLTKLEVPEGVTTIPAYTFHNLTSLETIVLPCSLKSIKNNAFYGCRNLVSLTIPEGLESIGSNAFDQCVSLEAVEIFKGVTVMDKTSFAGCSKLTIYCYSGSKAHLVSEEAGYTFVLLDAHDHIYKQISQAEPTCTKNGNRKYVCTVCTYPYTEVIDAKGHTPGDWEITEGNCESGGSKVRRCTVCKAVITKETIPAGGHDWGEWEEELKPTIFQEGKKVRACGICGKRDEQPIEKITVDITETDEYGLVHMRVVDATNKEPVPGASILITTDSDGEVTLIADADGKISQILPVGTVKLSVYAKDYRVRNISITVKPGETELPVIGISTGELVTGELTSREMTYEEILAAGIDPDDPSNQHVFKYELKLRFRKDYDPVPIEYIYNPTTKEYHPSGPAIIDPPPVHLPRPGGDPIVIPFVPPDSVPIGPPDTPDPPDPEDPPKQAYRIIFPDGGTATVYPVAERYFLIIYGEARWLKEMYDVELLVVNESLTDTIERATAELFLPDGLSLAAMVGEEQSLVQNMGTVEPGSSKSVHWYVRGDKEGEYTLHARLSGTMAPFGDSFDYLFQTPNALKVYAGSAMKMTFHVPDTAFKNTDYTVVIELENVSDKTLYNVSHAITEIEQYKITYYSDGSEERTDYSPTGGTGLTFVNEFHPGDKLLLETTSKILFDTDQLMEHMGSWSGYENGMELLKETLEVVKDGMEVRQTAQAQLNNLVGILNALEDSEDFETPEHKESCLYVAELLTQVLEICQNYPSSTALTALGILKGSDVWSLLMEMTDPDMEITSMGHWEWAELTKQLEATIEDAKKDRPAVDPYDSLKSIVSMTPIKYILEDVQVTMLEESTTEIPVEIIIENTSGNRFGIESIGHYLYGLMTSGEEGQVITPDTYKLLGYDGQENIAYYDGVEYVKTANGETTVFLAADSGGSSQFHAWYVPKDSGVSGQAEGDSFVLNVNNDTGKWEDGILTFTGSGIISLTPMDGNGGTLHVKLPDGTVKDYDIVVVEAHSCAGEWETIVSPVEGLPGMKLQRCAVCEDIINVQKTVACNAHTYGAFQVEAEPDGETSGIRKRVCSECGGAEYEFFDAPEEEAPSVTRIYGDNRYQTAITAAKELKKILGIEKYDSIIIASGMNFADALAGSYLAAQKQAPILLGTAKSDNANLAYIQENLKNGGTVYILGGTGAVSESIEKLLKDVGIQVKRLSGKDRYLTNLMILEEAGFSGGEVLVAIGNNFADSLSASATGKPILLVGPKWDKISKDYVNYLSGKNCTFTIIGGTGAVKEAIEEDLKNYGEVRRIYGNTRMLTSVKVAENFFDEPKAAVLAYSGNFPDGLCGGPLAYALGAPLLLVNAGKEAAPAAYVAAKGISNGYVMGGEAVVSNGSVKAVFPDVS